MQNSPAFRAFRENCEMLGDALQSPADAATPRATRYPELSGARVLVTGLSAASGASIVAALAEQGARLLVETTEPNDRLSDFVGTSTGGAIEITRGTGSASDRVRETTQAAARTFGSLDVVINLVPALDLTDVVITDPDELEVLMADQFAAAITATQVAANRIGLTWRPGVIVNVLSVEASESPEAPGSSDPVQTILSMLVRDTLAHVTRREAERWADQGVRINAVVA
ncbi:MAG: SDR family oxidoreductase, partial [Pseudomonadota bacterium]